MPDLDIKIRMFFSKPRKFVFEECAYNTDYDDIENSNIEDEKEED